MTQDEFLNELKQMSFIDIVQLFLAAKTGDKTLTIEDVFPLEIRVDVLKIYFAFEDYFDSIE
jgi:hypothetical protein